MRNTNPYQQLISPQLYAKVSKEVLAAVAVSALNMLQEDKIVRGIVPADQSIWNEWKALYDNGIVPQKPPVYNPGRK